jgi:hypothetical protein
VILDEEGSVEDMDMPSGEEVSPNAVDIAALVVYVTLASILACCCRSWTHMSMRRLLQASRKQTQTQQMMMQVRQACLKQKCVIVLAGQPGRALNSNGGVCTR